MNLVRTIGAALLLALVPSTYAQEAQAAQPAGTGDGEWNTPYGMIFSVQNVFQNGDRAIIGDFGGGVGLQYTLAPQRALRISVNLSRESAPTYTRDTVDLANPTATPVEQFVRTNANFTSRYDVDLGALYVMRLAPSPVAPYLGVGGGIGFFQSANKYEDDVSSTTAIFNRDDMTRDISLNAAGVLGLEWRVHKSVALFAEYGLGVDLITYNSVKTESRTNLKSDGTLAAGTESEGSYTKFFNFGTGIGQGGQLGLVAFF